jgi:hypothetical protein
MSIDQSTAYSFGQPGSAYLTGAGIFEPPTGMVVVSIVSLDSVTAFTQLVPVNGPGSAYFGTTTPHATLNGTNPSALPTTETFPAGVTLFGRWSKVQINGTGAAVMLYFGY